MSAHDPDPGAPSDKKNELMLGDADRAALLTALTTEHFVLQTAASTTVTEASARASLYLMTLSSSLIAIGFTFGSAAFAPLIGTVTPVIVLLGIFTVVRLVDTGVENVASLTAIARIRSFCRTLGPTAALYFPSPGDSDDEALYRITASPQPKRPPNGKWMGAKSLFTMASMIAVPNSIVAGAGVTLAFRQMGSGAVAFVVGALVVCTFLGAFLWYQNGRYQAFDRQMG